MNDGTTGTAPTRPFHLEAVAYHEAGHAVIGYLLGGDLVAVSITPKGPNAGRCECTLGGSGFAIMYDLAGQLAESLQA